MTEDLTSRRALLRRAFTGAGRIANAGRANSEDAFAVARDHQTVSAANTPLTRARSSTRTATLAELLAAADELGLRARHDELVAAARISVQLTPSARPDGPARFGGATQLPQGCAWPSVGGRALTLLAQVDLAQVDLAQRTPTGLPFQSQGTLLFFFDTASMPAGLDAADRGGGCVLHVNRDSPWTPASGPALPHSTSFGDASLELVIPRVWSARIEALALSGEEREAWELLRQRLASSQGTELTEQAVSHSRVSHRILGYPEDTGGDMPLICELCDRGHRIEGHALTHPEAGDAERESDRWELLAQFSRDAELEWDWGGGIARIYFWIDRARMGAGDPSRVWAIAR